MADHHPLNGKIDTLQELLSETEKDLTQVEQELAQAEEAGTLDDYLESLKPDEKTEQSSDL